MKPVKNESTDFRSFIETDEIERIIAKMNDYFVRGSIVARKIDEWVAVCASAKQAKNQSYVDSLSAGSVMHQAEKECRNALIAIILVEAAYAIEALAERPAEDNSLEIT